ncbi:MAG TPA: M20/M25/M40 family metallo-hydrolase [Gaiellaceae bacterium]|nr:M20/M25/M40 family metallo-hydrolase [Gaiellaceae bacterium]
MTVAPDTLSLFLELAAIPSPSGEERAVAERVSGYLGHLGLAVERDDFGNLLARMEPTATDGGVPIFLCSHLDTVPPTGPIEPVVDDGVVRNAAGTILGADNKASVAAMLEVARRLREERRPHAGVELLFTLGEETGLEGAKAFDPSRLDARLGFVFDYSGRIGHVVSAAPYARKMRFVVKGRAAHSGIAPEEGRSAIYAAARAIADLRLGRIDEETTANVGKIEGGTAGNVVPDRCRVSAEARSRDARKLANVVQEILDSFAFGAAASECELETTVNEDYEGYRFRPDDPVFSLACRALERAGFDPRPVEVGGGSDANVFNARGVPCVNIANGMSDVHTPDEHIAVEDLDAIVRVSLELVDLARAA